MTINLGKQEGITLIELLIVAAIVAIIAAIALPSFNDSATKTRRGECKSLLLEAAQLQERHYTEHGRYATGFDTGLAASETNIPFNTTSDNGYCTLSIAEQSDPPTDFNLQATPSGTSHTDNQCGWLRLSNAGLKTTQITNEICRWP